MWEKKVIGAHSDGDEEEEKLGKDKKKEIKLLSIQLEKNN